MLLPETSKGFRAHALRLLLVLATATACSSQNAAAPPASPGGGVPRHSTRIDVPRTLVTPHEAISVSELYAEGQQRFERGQWEASARTFDRLYAADPNGPYGPSGLFYAAWAYDNAGDNASALARYLEFARRFPEHGNAQQSLVRAARLLTHEGQWQGAGEVADKLLARISELSEIEKVVAYGAKALALLFAGDVESSEYFIDKGRSVAEHAGLASAGQIPADLARLYFALGELRRVRGERIVFDPRPDDFGAALERRCQLLLDAQSAYSDAMRAYDARWSSMAGYRVGELYQKLHADIMSVPRPSSADNEARERLFEGAMRLRYAVLLDKGLAMMTHTIAMAERTGEQSEWILKTREARDRLEEARVRERAALDALPYSREQLQRALDDLARKARESTRRR